LYHLVPDSTISKYGLLCLFKKVFKRDDIEINEYDDFILDKSLINTRHDFEFMVSDYERMIVEMRNWMVANREFYPHYNF
jgi:dTDP-4-dehydrorhamnose reductase